MNSTSATSTYQGNIDPLLGVAFRRIIVATTGRIMPAPPAPEMTQTVTTFIEVVKDRRMALYYFRAIGLVGAAVFVVAYFANQARWLDSRDWRFPAANLVGALLILVSLFGEWNLPSVVIEAFWAAISVYGLFNRPRPG
jgi:hypothetical protein